MVQNESLLFSIQSVNSQAIFVKFCKPYFLVIWHPEHFVNIYYCIDRMLDHLTCSKWLFITLYDIYKPNNFIPVLFSELRYMSNGLTCQIVKFCEISGLLPND